MKMRGRRFLVVPPGLGFGAQELKPGRSENGAILAHVPANSTLLVEATVLKVKFANPQTLSLTAPPPGPASPSVSSLAAPADHKLPVQQQQQPSQEDVTPRAPTQVIDAAVPATATTPIAAATSSGASEDEPREPRPRSNAGLRCAFAFCALRVVCAVNAVESASLVSSPCQHLSVHHLCV